MRNEREKKNFFLLLLLRWGRPPFVTVLLGALIELPSFDSS